ncbi:MAG: hypothetical protein JWP12_2706 [Bacteroidetes bacterium]|nr:hypothetical protein [Bacteroidota bacterium]
MTDLKELLENKSLKAKEKTEALSTLLLEKKVSMNELLSFATSAKDPVKATCIEAIEFASKKDPAVVTKKCFEFVTVSLTEKAPRIKWESAKVIGTTAHLFPKQLDAAIGNLLVNTEHTGTVVCWSAAFALGGIIQLKTAYNKTLLPAIEAIMKREEKNSIKKIYAGAIKKIK